MCVCVSGGAVAFPVIQLRCQLVESFTSVLLMLTCMFMTTDGEKPDKLHPGESEGASRHHAVNGDFSGMGSADMGESQREFDDDDESIRGPPAHVPTEKEKEKERESISTSMKVLSLFSSR